MSLLKLACVVAYAVATLFGVDASFLPDKPASGPSCTTPINGFKGTCISRSACTGATFNGVCSGGNVCCVAETTSVDDSTTYVTYETFKASFTAISATRAQALYPYFNDAMARLLWDKPSDNVQCQRLATFIAQMVSWLPFFFSVLFLCCSCPSFFLSFTPHQPDNV